MEQTDWTLEITSKAEKKILTLKRDEQAHVRSSLDLLISKPERADVKKMKGRDKGKSRQRIGKWRAVFQIDPKRKKVVVIDFGARGDIYK